ncbi:MAG TPA: hypothetical protein VF100_01180 [Thermoanaerobaculia bacterium]
MSAPPAGAPPEIELLLDVLALAVPPRSAAFVSGPMTPSPGRAADHGLAPDEVRRRNARAIEGFATRLRARQGGPVISPAGLDVPGWRGRDYGELFRRVIERFAAEVWFLEGWQFSPGCVQEIATCFRLGIRCLDQEGEPIDRPAAVRKVRQALEISTASGAGCASLEASFEALESG